MEDFSAPPHPQYFLLFPSTLRKWWSCTKKNHIPLRWISANKLKKYFNWNNLQSTHLSCLQLGEKCGQNPTLLLRQRCSCQSTRMSLKLISPKTHHPLKHCFSSHCEGVNCHTNTHKKLTFSPWPRDIITQQHRPGALARLFGSLRRHMGRAGH